jgi:hypothetical protein
MTAAGHRSLGFIITGVARLHDPIRSTNTQLQTPRAYPPQPGYCVCTSCVQLPNPLAVGHLSAVGHVCIIQHTPP